MLADVDGAHLDAGVGIPMRPGRGVGMGGGSRARGWDGAMVPLVGRGAAGRSVGKLPMRRENGYIVGVSTSGNVKVLPPENHPIRVEYTFITPLTCINAGI